MAGPANRAQPWWTLIGACAGLFILMLDSTVVTLALPSIQRDLGASLDGLQWVQNAYLLTLAALVVTGGRLGDILGRRLVFVWGMAIFAAGSVLSASAGGEAQLVGGRVLQGAGGSALLALSLAITSHAFPDELQGRVLGIWASVSAIALAIGPLVGGLLIDAASWRWIFWINLPVAALGIAILLLRGEESRDETAPRRVDAAGICVLGAGLTAIVFALVQADGWGWDSPATLGLTMLGLALLVAFWRVERAAPVPLGKSAIAAGALILPITAPMVFFSAFSGRVIARFGARATMTSGMVCALAGLLLQARVDAHSDYMQLLPGFLLFGISLALVYAPMSTAAMTAMPREKAGIACGVLAMNRVLAGAVLLAVTGAVFQGSLPASTESIAGAGAAAFTSALSSALLVPAGVVAVGAVLTWLLVPEPTRATPVPASELLNHQHHRRFHL